MNLYKAAFIHLLISFFIAFTIFASMYFLWYPGNYFGLMGGKKLLALIGFLDIFLGPLLTLIIFKPNKKGLKFDLACIAVLQIIALSYGINAMVVSRPVFTVFNHNKFQVMAQVDMIASELAKAKQAKWKTLSYQGPVLVAIGDVNGKDKKAALFAKLVASHAGHYPILFDDYFKHKNEVIKAGKPIALLAQKNKTNAANINQFLASNKHQIGDFLYFPVITDYAEMSVIVDARTAEVLTILDIN